MKYTIIVKKTTVRKLRERNFCFSCGCFQGGSISIK